MNNATFRIILNGKAHKTLIRGDSAQQAISRAAFRFPSVHKANLAGTVEAKLIRTHVAAVLVGGVVFHGPWADDEEQAHALFVVSMMIQYPGKGRYEVMSAVETSQYVLEQ